MNLISTDNKSTAGSVKPVCRLWFPPSPTRSLCSQASDFALFQ